MIAWPAIVHYRGDAALAYVENQAAWDAALHPHGARICPGDRLIDANGHIHALFPGKHGTTEIAPSDATATLEEVIALIRAHAAQEGACCVAKFHALTFAEAIAALRDMEHAA